jgi:hypothetical protein
MFLPPPVPESAPPLAATLERDGVVRLSWQRSAETIGLRFELHRSDQPEFAPGSDTLLTSTHLGEFIDCEPPEGVQIYALVVVSDDGGASLPAHAAIDVPPPLPPAAPAGLRTLPSSAAVRLRWESADTPVAGYHVYRGAAGETPDLQLTEQPVTRLEYSDATAQADTTYAYAVRAVSGRGVESASSATVEATAKIVREPMFFAALQQDAEAVLYGDDALPGKLHGAATVAGGALDATRGGHVTYPHHGYFDLGQPLSVECWVWFDQQGTMPVFVSCGRWNQAGWFLQWLGGRFRWHLGGVDCDGGQPATGRWIHLAGVYDGQNLRLYQDGTQVAHCPAAPITAPWPGPLHIGQYSGDASAQYQLHGRIRGVKLYHRALETKEVADAARLQSE